jgi:hypothetical protein
MANLYPPKGSVKPPAPPAPPSKKKHPHFCDCDLCREYRKKWEKCLEKKMAEKIGFSYVNITTKGCEGWLNLFIDGYPIALVNNVFIANKIRARVPKQKIVEINPCKCDARKGEYDKDMKYICQNCGKEIYPGPKDK